MEDNLYEIGRAAYDVAPRNADFYALVTATAVTATSEYLKHFEMGQKTGILGD